MESQKRNLYLYILDKLQEGDYHAVSDAANDLRVLETRENFLDSLLDLPSGYSFAHNIKTGRLVLCFKGEPVA